MQQHLARREVVTRIVVKVLAQIAVIGLIRIFFVRRVIRVAGLCIYIADILASEQIENLKGSFTAKAGPGLDMSSTGEVCRFTGTVWKDDQLPLFRISKADEKNQQLSIDVELTENYEFDKVFVKIKVVSPAQGILLFSKELAVNEEQHIAFRRKTVKIDFPDLHVQKNGSYYVQVFHQMVQSRVNGVESISNHLTEK